MDVRGRQWLVCAHFVAFFFEYILNFRPHSVTACISQHYTLSVTLSKHCMVSATSEAFGELLVTLWSLYHYSGLLGATGGAWCSVYLATPYIVVDPCT